MSRAAPLLAALALAGCGEPHRAQPPPPPPASAPTDAAAHPIDAAARLEALEREQLDGVLAFSPSEASWLGATGWDDKLDDASPEAQAREVVRLRGILERSRALPEAELDPPHKIDRALLEQDVRARLHQLLEVRPRERSPLWYVDLASSALEVVLSHDGPPLGDRLRAACVRLARLRLLFDQARRSLKNPPELATRRAIEHAQSLRGFVAETLPRAIGAVGDEKLLAELRTVQPDALRAIDELISWLQRDLLPRSRGELALGRERLAERLRALDGVELPVELLQAAGERELKSARQRYEDLAAKLAPGKTPLEAARVIEEDRAPGDDLAAAARAALDQAVAATRAAGFATVPDPRPEVAEMPPYLWGIVELSEPGPLADHGRAVWWVDPVDKSWTRKQRDEHLRAASRPQLQIAALHEVVPGHWLQAELTRRAPSLVERFAGSTATREGWAAYAEQQAILLGFPGADPKLRLAEARAALVRVGRFVAALRFHAGGAKIEDLTKLFTDDCYLEGWAAGREAERAALDPLALAPTLGRLWIERLRDDARAARGADAFRLGELHDQLLAHGAPPLAILRRVVLPNAPPPSGL